MTSNRQGGFFEKLLGNDPEMKKYVKSMMRELIEDLDPVLKEMAEKKTVTEKEGDSDSKNNESMSNEDYPVKEFNTEDLLELIFGKDEDKAYKEQRANFKLIKGGKKEDE
ncbi:MAG: hypothetical protein JXR91_09015 [Deltaproteobacteria bacterium]|nr:hypothetical protein [Deltaproteobacteria bacterium]